MMTFRAIVFSLLAASLLVACQPETTRDTTKLDREIDAWATGQVVAKPDKPKVPLVMPRDDGPAWDWSDPCVENLHELTGALLLYYQAHKEMPERLDQISLDGLDGERISLTCPASGKRYIYVPGGLVQPRDIIPEEERDRGPNHILLYDAEPAHEITQHLTDGKKNWDEKKMVRYGIVMEPFQDVPYSTMRLHVVLIEQALLDAYVRETARVGNAPQQQPQPSQVPAPAKRPGPSLW